MSNKFAGQVITLVLVNVIIKLFWMFGVERGVQLAVGFETYGLYYSLFNFTYILSIITDPGINNYLMRTVAQEYDPRKSSDLLFLKLLLSGVYLIITLILGYFSGYQKDYFILLFVLCIFQMSWSFLTFLRSYLKGFQLFKAETFFSVFDKVLMVLIFIPLLYIQHEWSENILFFAVCQTTAVIISIGFCLTMLMRKKNIHFCIRIYKSDLSILRKLLPFALFAFLVLTYNKIDSVMLEKMLPNGKLETGIYAAAYRLLDASNIIFILFASIFYPSISKYLGQKKNIAKLVNDSFELLMVISLLISFSCWFFRDPIMYWLYKEMSTDYLADVFGILMFSSPLMVLYYVFSSVLTANNNLKALNIISALGLSVNIIFNILLIPTYQAYGASLSTLAALLFTGSTYWAYYYIYFKTRMKLLFIFKIIVFIGLLIFSGNYLADFSPYWMVNFGFFIMLSLSYIFILKLASFNKLRSFIEMR